MSRIANTPALQAVEQGERTINIQGQVFPLYKGYGSLQQLHDLAARAQPLRLVSGNTTGRNNLGYWVIKSIEQTNSVFIAAGQEQLQEFRLSLSFFGRKYND